MNQEKEEVTKEERKSVPNEQAYKKQRKESGGDLTDFWSQIEAGIDEAIKEELDEEQVEEKRQEKTALEEQEKLHLKKDENRSKKQVFILTIVGILVAGFIFTVGFNLFPKKEQAESGFSQGKVEKKEQTEKEEQNMANTTANIVVTPAEKSELGKLTKISLEQINEQLKTYLEETIGSVEQYKFYQDRQERLYMERDDHWYQVEENK